MIIPEKVWKVVRVVAKMMLVIGLIGAVVGYMTNTFYIVVISWIALIVGWLFSK